MKFKIIRSKFLEGLASIQNIVAEHCKSGELPILVEAVGDTLISSSAAFRAGLVEEYNTEHGCNCPLCGGRLEYVTGPNWDDVLVCEQCRNEIPDDIAKSKIYRVSKRGMAEFVRKQLGLDYAQHMGDENYRLGKLHGKKVFVCFSPSAGFYNAHNKDSIFIMCDVSSVPTDWTANGCHAILFGELFYDKPSKGEFGIAKDILEDLMPKDTKRRFGKNRVIHKGRDYWLSVIMNILSTKYQESDFRDSKLTGAAAMRWFRKVYPKYKGCARTFTRQMEEFTTYDKEKDRYDKREPLIANLLKYLANPNTPQEDRIKTAKGIADLLDQAKQATRRNGGIPVELPESSWSVGEDGKSERVLTVSADTIYDNVDNNLGKRQREEAAA